ncbi:alpha/beta hydrolase fold domain-containing protein [Altererythrobacter aerius]|uniref:Alpha/beta hydrolase fold domain-containing protein n=1 Tax=Tsuneonella aeria TaxID=1837929 RepID=A0A6I4T8V3_9SPHN|nr:alpha/beta hydrolase [Tsuneonella aeria]MXO73751.1 alpha/beta hydrolase fold domain-containing protein [Tsuneonella aeria]
MADTELYVRDDVKGFLDMLAAMNGPQMDEVPLAEARAAFATMGQLAEADAHDLAVVRDLTCPGPAGEIPLRLYDPRTSREAGPAVMFFHGGGFVIGDLETHNAFCTELAHQLDLPVIAVHYRLAPEAPFPAAPDDCEAASRWVAESPAALGFQVTGIITTGDSAGGNLAIVTAQALSDEPAAVPVVLQAPIYPVAGPVEETFSFKTFSEGFLLTARTMGFFSSNYAADPADKRNYPILHDDHAAAPPTVLLTAGLDPLRDSGRDYAAHLVQAGVDVIYLEARGNIHGFVNIRKAVPSAQRDVTALTDAIKLMLARHG